MVIAIILRRGIIEFREQLPFRESFGTGAGGIQTRDLHNSGEEVVPAIALDYFTRRDDSILFDRTALSSDEISARISTFFTAHTPLTPRGHVTPYPILPGYKIPRVTMQSPTRRFLVVAL